MTHIVSRSAEPFLAHDGRLEVHQVYAAHDNVIWLVRCVKTGETAIVDGPDAASVLQYVEAKELSPSVLLNTHTHGDHVGINMDLARRGLLDSYRVIGRGAVPGLTREVSEGDLVKVGQSTGRVLLTEGHLDNHVSYVFDDLLFCGDALFAGGCGRLFDGPAAKMFDSLLRMAELDGSTRVCCGHDYTLDNLRFAWSVEPDNEALAERIRRVWALSQQGRCALPSTIEEERATNPFLRPGSPTLIAAVSRALPDLSLDDHLEVFAATRALKDRGDYRQIPNESLPLNS